MLSRFEQKSRAALLRPAALKLFYFFAGSQAGDTSSSFW
jgi:hypothetical protein